MDDKMMESGKAYIVFTPTGIGKTKKIDIENAINLTLYNRKAGIEYIAVSYTHLTLPTICSV